jgi:probable rRNA maturation factor
MGATVTFDPASRPALGRHITQRALREFAGVLEKRVTLRRAFGCLITGDAELRRLNRQYLKKDYATDVLSFPAASDGRPIPASERTLGELAISADRALMQARECGHAIGDELRILMLHGILHLIGMDHETDQGEMARAESRWRKMFGLPGGLIERARR